MPELFFGGGGTRRVPCSVCDVPVGDYFMVGQDELCIGCYAWLVFYLHQVALMWKEKACSSR